MRQVSTKSWRRKCIEEVLVEKFILCLFIFTTKFDSEHLTATLAKYGPAANLLHYLIQVNNSDALSFFKTKNVFMSNNFAYELNSDLYCVFIVDI